MELNTLYFLKLQVFIYGHKKTLRKVFDFSGKNLSYLLKISQMALMRPL